MALVTDYSMPTGNMSMDLVRSTYNLHKAKASIINFLWE